MPRTYASRLHRAPLVERDAVHLDRASSAHIAARTDAPFGSRGSRSSRSSTNADDARSSGRSTSSAASESNGQLIFFLFFILLFSSFLVKKRKKGKKKKGETLSAEKGPVSHRKQKLGPKC
jgi:hypothetical protein